MARLEMGLGPPPNPVASKRGNVSRMFRCVREEAVRGIKDDWPYFVRATLVVLHLLRSMWSAKAPYISSFPSAIQPQSPVIKCMMPYVVCLSDAACRFIGRLGRESPLLAPDGRGFHPSERYARLSDNRRERFGA